ncbi:MAG: hypothetical protein ACRYFS_11815 [Janthinobacterium lividum]
MFKFAEGAQVAIKSDNATLGLMAGDIGKVWALYSTEPPAYEVTFCAQDSEFDALMYEDELVEPVTERETLSVRSENTLVSA